MKYPHLLTISIPGEGAPEEDPESGTYVPPDPVVIFEGRADVQDVDASVVRGQDNVVKNSEATAFLQDESAIPNIKTGMSCTIVWNPDEGGDQTEDAVVDTVTRLDGTIGLRRV